MHKPALPQKNEGIAGLVPQMLLCMCCICSLQPGRGIQVPLLHPPPPLAPFPPPFPAYGWQRAACGLRRLPSVPHRWSCCGREGCQLQLQSASILGVSEFTRRSPPGGSGRLEVSNVARRTGPIHRLRFLASGFLLPSLGKSTGTTGGGENSSFQRPEPDEHCPVHTTRLKATTTRSVHQRHLLAPRSDAVLFLCPTLLCLTKGENHMHPAGRPGCMRGTVPGCGTGVAEHRRAP